MLLDTFRELLTSLVYTIAPPVLSSLLFTGSFLPTPTPTPTCVNSKNLWQILIKTGTKALPSPGPPRRRQSNASAAAMAEDSIGRQWVHLLYHSQLQDKIQIPLLCRCRILALGLDGATIRQPLKTRFLPGVLSVHDLSASATHMPVPSTSIFHVEYWSRPLHCAVGFGEV